MTHRSDVESTSRVASQYGHVIAPGTVRLERFLPGPIERVWQYLTDADKRALWLAAGPMELRVGGRVEHVFRNSDLTNHPDTAPAKYAHLEPETRMHGRITAIDPPRLLAYTWAEGSGDASEVRFELATEGSGVRLTVTHERLATRDDMIGVAGGWHAHLDILDNRLAGREPAEGFWAVHTRLEREYEGRIPSPVTAPRQG